MDTRLIALDIDGTIKASGMPVSDRVITAVRAGIESGLFITLSTGRCYEGTASIAAELGIRIPLILFGGAELRDPVDGSLLASASLPAESVALALRIARR